MLLCGHELGTLRCTTVDKPPRDIPPNTLVREWDLVQQKVVVKDRITYFADKFRAADNYGTKATGFALLGFAAAFIALMSWMHASSTARMACAVVIAAWGAKEDADDDSPAPQWLAKTNVEDALEACGNHGYIK